MKMPMVASTHSILNIVNSQLSVVKIDQKTVVYLSSCVTSNLAALIVSGNVVIFVRVCHDEI